MKTGIIFAVVLIMVAVACAEEHTGAGWVGPMYEPDTTIPFKLPAVGAPHEDRSVYMRISSVKNKANRRLEEEEKDAPVLEMMELLKEEKRLQQLLEGVRNRIAVLEFSSQHWVDPSGPVVGY